MLSLYRGHGLFVLAAAWCAIGSVSASSTGSSEDTMCMIQSVPKVDHAYPEGGDKSKLTPWDLDYIDDEAEKPKATPETAMTPEMRRGLFITMSISLLVVLLALLVCLLSGPRASDGVHKQMTYGFISHAIAVFAALLIFRASKDLCWHVVTVMSGHLYTAWSAVVLFAIIFGVVSILIFSLRSSLLTLLAVATIGMYVASFAAVDTYFIVVNLPFMKNGQAYAGAFFLAVFMIIALVVVSSGAREACHRSGASDWFCCCLPWGLEGALDSVHTPAWMQWKQQAATSEDQFAAVAIGYFLCQAAEACIIRSWSPTTIPTDVRTLVAAMVGYIIVSQLIVYCARGNSEDPPSRMSLLLQNACLMAAAWCLFDAMAWHLSSASAAKLFAMAPASPTAALLIAIALSMVVVLAYVIVSYYSLVNFSQPWNDSQIGGMRVVVCAMSFVLGNAWALCLISAITSIGPKFFPALQISPAVGTASSYLVFSSLVIAIWGTCILPNINIMKLSSGSK